MGDVQLPPLRTKGWINPYLSGGNPSYNRGCEQWRTGEIQNLGSSHMLQPLANHLDSLPLSWSIPIADFSLDGWEWQCAVATVHSAIVPSLMDKQILYVPKCSTSCGKRPLVLKHGVLGNPPFLVDVPLKTCIPKIKENGVYPFYPVVCHHFPFATAIWRAYLQTHTHKHVWLPNGIPWMTIMIDPLTISHHYIVTIMYNYY